MMGDDPVYDSARDAKEHIQQVQKVIDAFCVILINRGLQHDRSKLHEPEKSAFDRVIPQLEGVEYGSQEYKDTLKELGPALDHHYRVNRHHPEHFENGIVDMNLFDLLEMLADWKAAGLRYKGSSLERSLDINVERFNIPSVLEVVLRNTIKEVIFLDD